jgi:hypothetical protein
MGSHTFDDEAFGKTMPDAYRAACNAALHEYGHDAYNGTISTTEGAVQIVKPKGWTDDDMVLAMLMLDDAAYDPPYGHGMTDLIPNLPVRRKFRSDHDRMHYKKQRALLNKWKRLDVPTRRALVDTARKVEKWGPCAAWPADRKTETTHRERHGLKGKRGNVWMFWGWAAS